MSRIDKIAAQLDPQKAQTACAHILAALGGYVEWSSDHLEWIADAMKPVHQGTGLPAYTDQDDDAVEFWERYL